MVGVTFGDLTKIGGKTMERRQFFVKSYDFDLQGQEGTASKFVSVSRFLPDFKTIAGNATVTLAVKSISALYRSFFRHIFM